MRNVVGKTGNRDFNSFALLLVCLFSLSLSGCSGLVTANNGTPPPPALAISSVQASAPTTTGFQVSWSTSVAANSAVDYGTSANYGSSTTTNSSMVISHQVAVTGLNAATLYHFRVRSTDASSVSASSPDMTFATAGDTIPPTVSITAPANGATVSGALSVTANASDNVGVASVQFKLDGANLGAIATTAPYSIAWDSTKSSNGTHILSATATDTSGNTASSANVSLTVSNSPDTTPPTVSITAPANGATVSGTLSVTANASDNVGVASVQFQLDGANLGGLDTNSPYSASWNTTTASNAAHQLTAIAKDAAGNSTTSAIVTVTVSNVADTTPPSVPTGLSATAISSSQINLSWTASTDNVGVTGYNIFRGGSKIATSASSSFQDAGLSASTSYTYNVSAFDAAGNTSAQSAAASATTQASGGGGGIPTSLGWYQIPNTQLSSVVPSQATYPEIWGATGGAAIVTAWGSAIPDVKRNRYVVDGGGHSDYFGNGVYAVDLNASPIAWVVVNPTSHGSNVSGAGSCPESYLDGSMSSRHGFNGLQYIASQDKYFFFGAGKPGCGSLTDAYWEFDPATLSWIGPTAKSPGPAPGSSGGVPESGYDSVSGNIYWIDGNAGGGQFWVLNTASNTWTQLTNSLGTGCSTTNPNGDIDPVRRLYVCFGSGTFAKIPLGGPYTATKLSGSGCNNVQGSSGAAIVYDPVNRDFVLWNGGNTVYQYNPDTDSCTSQTYTGGPPSQAVNGTLGKMRYFPAVGVFVMIIDWNTNVYTLRLTAPSGSGGSGPNISNVTASMITTSGANVGWTTDVPATSQVEYGTTTAYGTMTTLNASLVTSHSVSLTGLSTSTLYHYRVHSKNSSGVEAISADAAFQTSNTTDTTPPTVSITAPAANASLTGTVNVTASASDNVGVTGVQFLLDGNSLGARLTSSPYQVSWDTSTATNGTHTLSANAFDAAGNVGNAVGVAVTVSNSTSSAQQDFQTRCAQTGVLVCVGFDAAADIPQGTYLFPASDGVYRATIDTTVSASGGGSLMFTVPSNANANGSGYWAHPFNQSFGQNSVFYVQYHQRFSPEFLTNNWQTSSGTKTFWKQSDFHWGDFATKNFSTCGQIELTTVDFFQVGSPTMYTGCGQTGMYTGSAPLIEQGDTPTTGYNCNYNNINGPGNSCFHYPSNTWVTFYYKITIGTWGQPNSLVQAWVSVGGQPYQEWVNWTGALNFDTATINNYNYLSLFPYMTGRDASISAGPTAYTWYDELIVSSQPIVAPNH